MSATINCTADHLSRANFVTEASDVLSRPGVFDTVLRLAEQGLAQAVIHDDGTVLGIISAAPVLPGVCEVFILATHDQKKHPIAFASAVKKKLLDLHTKFRRIQATAKNDEFHKRWLLWLGFEFEGVLVKFCLDGRDASMWSITQ